MVIAITGESASGKSTVEKELVQLGHNKIISYTTRPPRNDEIDGGDYYFITKEKFEILQTTNFFAEVGEYRGWLYGSAVKDYTDDNVVVLTPHGLRQIKKIKDLDIHSFYINVPRRDRLIKILQRGDQIEEAYRRSLTDVGVFDGIQDEVDFVINNEGYTKTPEELAYTIHVLSQEKELK